jgi:hypothetical protein
MGYTQIIAIVYSQTNNHPKRYCKVMPFCSPRHTGESTVLMRSPHIEKTDSVPRWKSGAVP